MNGDLTSLKQELEDIKEKFAALEEKHESLEKKFDEFKTKAKATFKCDVCGEIFACNFRYGSHILIYPLHISEIAPIF